MQDLKERASRLLAEIGLSDSVAIEESILAALNEVAEAAREELTQLVLTNSDLSEKDKKAVIQLIQE
jgi:hypothetical protein